MFGFIQKHFVHEWNLKAYCIIGTSRFCRLPLLWRGQSAKKEEVVVVRQNERTRAKTKAGVRRKKGALARILKTKQKYPKKLIFPSTCRAADGSTSFSIVVVVVIRVSSTVSCGRDFVQNHVRFVTWTFSARLKGKKHFPCPVETIFQTLHVNAGFAIGLGR